MGAGDLVIYLDDPLLMGGELLIVAITPDGRLVCEAVHHDEGEAPARAVLYACEVELASIWARTG